LISVGLFASPRRLWDAYQHNNHPGLLYTWSAGYTDATLLGTNIVGLLFILGWVSAFMFPFFIWLDWRGWFRSDPLEEIVGLDTSYHGGLFLMNGEDEVNPEFISAYKQKREGLRQRKPITNMSREGSFHGIHGHSGEGRMMAQHHAIAASRNGTHIDEEDALRQDNESDDDDDDEDYDHGHDVRSEHTPEGSMINF
jgi:hypothetical protein